MKTLTRTSILLISIPFALLLGTAESDSQDSQYIIKLKSGVEIKAEKIVIEDDLVFYLFSSFDRKKLGIDKSSIAEIIEIEKGTGREAVILPARTDSAGKSSK